MKTKLFTRLCAGLILTIAFTAFSKPAVTDQNKFHQKNGSAQFQQLNKSFLYSEILNQDLHVTYATDGGNDITEDMNDFTFRFEGNSPAGVAQAWNDILSSTGSWSMSEGSGNISIAYPSRLSQLMFMSRDWTIGEAAKGGEIVFTAADGDEVHFISNIQ